MKYTKEERMEIGRRIYESGLKKNENRLYAMFACANLYSLAITGRKLSTI